MKFLQEKYECLKQSDLFEKKIEISHYIVNELKDKDIWELDILEELTAVRYDENELELSEEEIVDLLQFVAIS